MKLQLVDLFKRLYNFIGGILGENNDTGCFGIGQHIAPTTPFTGYGPFRFTSSGQAIDRTNPSNAIVSYRRVFVSHKLVLPLMILTSFSSKLSPLCSSSDPAIPHVEQLNELRCIIPPPPLDISTEKECFDLWLKVMQLNSYRKAVIAGLVSSIGSLTESLVGSSKAKLWIILINSCHPQLTGQKFQHSFFELPSPTGGREKIG